MLEEQISANCEELRNLNNQNSSWNKNSMYILKTVYLKLTISDFILFNLPLLKVILAILHLYFIMSEASSHFST